MCCFHSVSFSCQAKKALAQWKSNWLACTSSQVQPWHRHIRLKKILIQNLTKPLKGSVDIADLYGLMAWVSIKDGFQWSLLGQISMQFWTRLHAILETPLRSYKGFFMFVTKLGAPLTSLWNNMPLLQYSLWELGQARMIHWKRYNPFLGCTMKLENLLYNHPSANSPLYTSLSFEVRKPRTAFSGKDPSFFFPSPLANPR